MKHTASIDSIKPKVSDSKIFVSDRKQEEKHEYSTQDLRFPILRTDMGGRKIIASNADLLVETNLNESHQMNKKVESPRSTGKVSILVKKEMLSDINSDNETAQIEP